MARPHASLMLLLLVGVHQLAVHFVRAAGTCQEHVLDFILLAGDALSAQIEDDVKRDLAKIGITVNTRLLQKADFNKAMQDGDFHMCFTESWGPPYDPHAFATGWFRPKNEAHYPALDGLEAPMTKKKLEQMVSGALKVENLAVRQARWKEILQEMHKQAISNPMWSRRMPAVLSRRLQGYAAGPQQFDYPVHLVNVQSGSTTVTVAPGAQTGLFVTTGPMDPHSYRPNEFFISNWIYEGLVSYGQGGAIAPMLATSWTVKDTPLGGQEFRFTLRANVKFHDGSAFNCAAVKMNFDHVLQPPLNTLNYHGWYHLPKYTKDWSCDGETFVVNLSEVYYPFLQELSLIRPLRMLSPKSFKAGAGSDPMTQNSCPLKWDRPENMDGSKSNVRCVGVDSFSGTGPWVFADKTLRQDGSISQLKFSKNPNYWGIQGDIKELIVKNFDSHSKVEAALLDKTLDMVVGGGVLTPEQVKAFQTNHVMDFEVLYGPPLMNTIIVINAAKAPTADLQLRKVIMHAIDKAAIVDSELAGSASVADALFPKDAPYCDVDLTPRYDYDFEKAQLMNCPVSGGGGGGGGDDDTNLPLILGLTLGLGLPLVVALGAASYCFGKRTGYQQLLKEKPAGGADPKVIGNEA